MPATSGECGAKNPRSRRGTGDGPRGRCACLWRPPSRRRRRCHLRGTARRSAQSAWLRLRRPLCLCLCPLSHCYCYRGCFEASVGCCWVAWLSGTGSSGRTGHHRSWLRGPRRAATALRRPGSWSLSMFSDVAGRRRRRRRRRRLLFCPQRAPVHPDPAPKTNQLLATYLNSQRCLAWPSPPPPRRNDAATGTEEPAHRW